MSANAAPKPSMAASSEFNPGGGVTTTGGAGTATGSSAGGGGTATGSAAAGHTGVQSSRGTLRLCSCD